MTDQIKIAVLVPYPVFPPKMGGQKAIVLLYKYLSALSPLTFFTVRSNSTPDGMNIHCVPVMGNGKMRYVNPFLFFKMKSWIKKAGITQLILEHPYLGWLGFLLKHFGKVKIIIHSHNIESLRFRSTEKWWWGILWHYEKWTHRMAHESFFITAEDRQYAISHYGLSPEKCHTITYGIEEDSFPDPDKNRIAKEWLQSQYAINPQEKILLFNGTLDYLPNQKALNAILQEINPRLMKAGYHYKIIVCGKDLPASYSNLEAYRRENVIYAGFVEDITVYLLGSDIFLNAVIEGGGIKTKLVEALASNMYAVSTETGALGVPAAITGRKMILVKDGDWDQFTSGILSIGRQENIPDTFFSHFYWKHIAEKSFTILHSLHHNTL